MLNPITYTEQIIADFLKYQLTAYAFADANLHRRCMQISPSAAGLAAAMNYQRGGGTATLGLAIEIRKASGAVLRWRSDTRGGVEADYAPQGIAGAASPNRVRQANSAGGGR